MDDLMKEARTGLPALRDRYVALCYWCHANRDQIYYAQDRPIVFPATARHLPFTTDCSGIVTMLAKWCGMPDPNGENYNGSGYTGTLLDHLPAIGIHQTWRGDLAIFGPGTGDHVVSLLQGGDKYSDPLVMSHGHPGADDPGIFRLSNSIAEFNGSVRYRRMVTR